MDGQERAALLAQVHLSEEEFQLACLNAVADGHRASEVLEELVAYAGHGVPRSQGRHRRPERVGRHRRTDEAEGTGELRRVHAGGSTWQVRAG